MGKPVNSPLKAIVFTDLDGTLLDHAHYDFSPALPAMKALKERGIPLIPTTSKTYAEVEVLMGQLEISGIAILENGAAIHGIGEEGVKMEYGALRQRMNALPSHLRAQMRGFGDMSVDEVAEETGLDLEAAKRAKARKSSEPFIWSGSDEEMLALQEEMAREELTITRGGRFFHILPKTGKAEAMAKVIRHLNGDAPIQTLALGDGPNDIGMLEAADHGVIIPNPHGVDLTSLSQARRLEVAENPGPSGWNKSVLSWLAHVA